MFELFEHSFNQRALLAALLIGFSNGALGTLIVLRKSSLAVSALSHSLLPGIALSIMTFGGLTAMTGFFGALFGALFVGLGTVFISRIALLDDQTAMSVLYTSAFAGGLIMLEYLPHIVELEDWLFGNILGMRHSDLHISFMVSFVILMSLAIFRREWILFLFEPDIAASMGVRVRGLNYLFMTLMVLGLVTSLQAVGAVLSAALFITPTAILLQFMHSPRKLIWCSGILGALSATVAVVLSNIFNVRTGAMIILLLGILFILSLIIRPRKFVHRHSE